MTKKRHGGGLPTYGLGATAPTAAPGRVTYHSRREGNIEIAVAGSEVGVVGVQFGTKLVRLEVRRRSWCARRAMAEILAVLADSR